MKILFLTSHLPFPPSSGGRRREYELLRRIGAEYEVHLCALSKTYPEDQANAVHLETWCSSVAVFAVGNYMADKRCSLEGCPSQVMRHLSSDASKYIEKSLDVRDFDIVHVEGYYLMHHLPSWNQVPILLVEQNVEYLLCQQRMALSTEKDDLQREEREYRLTTTWERAAWRQASMCATVTEDDRLHIIGSDPQLRVRVVPDGADHQPWIPGVSACSDAQLQTRGEQPKILFVGNFGYGPNVDAAKYLVHTVLPLVHKDVASAKLLLVGNGPGPEVKALACDGFIDVTGRVPSLGPFLDAADVIVCPLRIGGGIKVKILESLRAGKAIVSTSVGIQGVDPQCRAAICVADDPVEFAKHVVRLITSLEERRHLEQLAKGCSMHLPTWDMAANALRSCYEELLVNCRPDRTG